MQISQQLLDNSITVLEDVLNASFEAFNFSVK